MRLYPHGLDMRARHPASNLVDRVLAKGVSTPHRPAFTNGRSLVAGEWEFRKALQLCREPFGELRRGSGLIVNDARSSAGA